MTEKTIQYFRPSSPEEALALKQQFGDKAQFLMGGNFKPILGENLEALIDLQETNFDDVEFSDSVLRFGGLVTLKTLEEALDLADFSTALSIEFGLNVRNSLSLSNFLAHTDGRSPILTCLVALDASVTTFDSRERVPLLSYLGNRELTDQVADLFIPEPTDLAFESVGRSPKDLPIVCVAACHNTGGGINLAFGGTEAVRLLSIDAENQLPEPSEMISNIFSGTSDQWGSEEYRAGVAEVLLRRTLKKINWKPGQQETK